MKTILLSLAMCFSIVMIANSTSPIRVNDYAANGSYASGSNDYYSIFERGNFVMKADAYSNGSGANGSSYIWAKLYNDGEVQAKVSCTDYDGKTSTWSHDEDTYNGWTEHMEYYYSINTSSGVSGSVSLIVTW